MSIYTGKDLGLVGLKECHKRIPYIYWQKFRVGWPKRMS